MIPPAFARGAWAVLATLALFQVVSFGEALLTAAATFAVGGRGTGALVAARSAVVLVGLAARAALLLRALRPPAETRLRPLETWQPVLLSVGAIVAAMATQGVHSLQTMLYARDMGAEALSRLMMATAMVSAAGYFADQVVMIVALWIAFVRGRDVAMELPAPHDGRPRGQSVSGPLAQ